MIKNYFISFFLALIVLLQYAWATDSADGASRTSREYSFPNLIVNSPSLPPYEDVIGGGGDPSTPAAADADTVPPPPPYCVYPPPPPAKPAMPAPLPPVASQPGAPPSPSAGSPSIIAPGISPLPMPGASPPAGSPSITPGSSSPPPPPLFMPPVAFPAPPPAGQQKARPVMWCVANPKVASAVVQTAMDYACGSGADCGMAAPGGPCYLPDTLTAHASYAFNSYWQRTKAAGGTCDFAGAAMLVTRDPSYEGCKYISM